MNGKVQLLRKSLAAEDLKIIQNIVVCNEFGLISDRLFYPQHSQLADSQSNVKGEVILEIQKISARDLVQLNNFGTAL